MDLQLAFAATAVGLGVWLTWWIVERRSRPDRSTGLDVTGDDDDTSWASAQRRRFED